MILEGKRFDNTKHAIYSGIDATGTTIYKVHVTQPTFSDTTSYILWGSNTYISSAMDAYGTLVTYNSHDEAGATIVIPKQQLYTDIFITSIPPNRVDTTTTTVPQCIATDPPYNTYPQGNDPFIYGHTDCEGGSCDDTCRGNTLIECYCPSPTGYCKDVEIDCTDWKNTVCDIDMGACHCTKDITGDIDGSRKVDIKDIFIVAQAYGSEIGKSKWNRMADFNDDGKINIADIYVVARCFGNDCSCKQGTYDPHTRKCEVQPPLPLTGKVVLISETFNIIVVLTTLIVLVLLFGLFKIRTKK
jgi:hypothetical protein